MFNTGGALDNSKKYIESGKFDGKGTLAHDVAVAGDVFGDPLKDTAEPSLHILIELLNTVLHNVASSVHSTKQIETEHEVSAGLNAITLTKGVYP
jgi:Na+/H+-translocating membrane pyrophosphatase